jgi:Ribonuclease G/E
MDPLKVLEALEYSRKCLEEMDESILHTENKFSNAILLEITRIKRAELVLAPKSRGHNCPHCGGSLTIDVR